MIYSKYIKKLTTHSFFSYFITGPCSKQLNAFLALTPLTHYQAFSYIRTMCIRIGKIICRAMHLLTLSGRGEAEGIVMVLGLVPGPIAADPWKKIFPTSWPWIQNGVVDSPII